MGLISPFSPASFSPDFLMPNADLLNTNVLDSLALPAFQLPAFAELSLRQDAFVSNMPKVELNNGPTQILVKVMLPEQMDPTGISVEVKENILTVRAKNRHESETRKQDEFYKSFTQRSFSREIKLPAEVDAKQTQARLEDRTLVVTLPKVSPAFTQSQSIPVQVSAPAAWRG